MDAVLQVTVEGDPHRRRLPPEPFTVGRGMGWAIEARDTWCSRTLVDLEPTDHGWLCRNYHDGLHLTGPHLVEEATYLGGAAVLLTTGTWTLWWNRRLTLEVTVTPSLSEEQRKLPIASQAGDLEALMTTDPRALQLSPTDLHRLAVLFRHLLEETDPPANLAAAAASALGMQEAVVRAYANRQRSKVEATDGLRLETVADLGEHLVRVTRQLRREHLTG